MSFYRLHIAFVAQCVFAKQRQHRAITGQPFGDFHGGGQGDQEWKIAPAFGSTPSQTDKAASDAQERIQCSDVFLHFFHSFPSAGTGMHFTMVEVPMKTTSLLSDLLFAAMGKRYTGVINGEGGSNIGRAYD
jgi:hypothetical protein